jgi:hypothetical protein
VHHIRAIADGGTNTLDNIRPMPRAAHIAEHQANGHYGRWGRRASIAGAYGGRVARSVPILDGLSIITGVLSGRIRIDNPDNFINDIFGMPSKEDQRKAYERYQRAIDPGWKPGDMAV